MFLTPCEKKIMILLLFLIAFLSQINAQDEDLRPHISFQMTDGYSSGPFLIYDCNKRSFICVDELNFNECRSERKFAIQQRYFNLPCAPLKEFKHYNYCVDQQYELVHNISRRDFCFANESLLRN